MRDETSTLLLKLTKGKNGLTEDQALAFFDDLRAMSREQFVGALYRPKVKRPAPANAAPSWLVEMEAARKRVRWTAAESVQALVRLAIDEGFVEVDPFLGRKAPPSFAVAAKKIAGADLGERLSQAFKREVARIEREYTLS